MSSRFSLEAILSLTDNLTKPYKQTTNRITALNRGLTGSFGTLNTGINKTIAFAGKGLLRAGQIGLGAMAVGAGLAARSFVDLDDAITNAGAKFKDLDSTSITFGDSLKELSDAARGIGAITEFDAVDAAGALDKFAMAGVSSSQAMALLAETTNLATAAGTDLTTAVDIVTDSLGAFGQMTTNTVLLGERMTKMSDQMAKTTTTANTSLVELFEAVGKGARTFTDAGQSMATFNSFAGVMANATIKGGEAGTALKNTMLRLANPSKEAAKVLSKLGVVTADANGDFRDIVDIIADFEKGLKGMGSEQRTAALGTIFGTKTVNGFNVLLGEGSVRLRRYREDIIDSEGASRKMADAIRNSLGNRIKVLKSGLTELGLKFIDAFDEKGRVALDTLIESIANFDMNIIIDGVNGAIEAFKKLGAFIVEHEGFIKGLIKTLIIFKAAVLTINAVMLIQSGIMAAMPVLATIKLFMALAKTEGILTTAQFALNTAMAANPIALAIVAVGVIIALFAKLVEKTGGVKAAFIAIGKTINTVLLSPINIVMEAVIGLIKLLSNIPGMGDKLKPMLDDWEAIQDSMNSVTHIGNKNEVANLLAADTKRLADMGLTRVTAGNGGSDNARPPGQQSSSDIPPTALQAIEREKAQQDREIKQRFDLNLNAPAGYSLGLAGETPSTSVSLGDQ